MSTSSHSSVDGTKPVYQCLRCGYETLLKHNFKTHCTKSKQCDPVLSNAPCDYAAFLRITIKPTSFRCPFCSKYLGSRNSLSNHKRRCRPDAETSTVTDEVDEELSQEHEAASSSTLTAEQAPLVCVVPFGNEDLSFLFEPESFEFMKRCMEQPKQGIRDIVNAVHFSESRPHMHNVCIPNVSRPNVWCFDGECWMLNDRSDVIKQLVKKSITVMFDFSYENAQALSKDIVDDFDKFEADAQTDVALQTEINKSVERLIVSRQDVVGVRQKMAGRG